MSREYSEDQLVQGTTADFLEKELGWESVYAHNTEVFGEDGTLGRKSDREVVLTRYLVAALRRLNTGLPNQAYEQATDALTAADVSKDRLQINREMYDLIRDGVPVKYKDAEGRVRTPRLRVIDFDDPSRNHFLAVREMWVRGSPYRRRPDIIGFVNGLPLLFNELKAHYRSVKDAHQKNLRDYLDTIPHLFHHNAVCLLSNGVEARVGTMEAPYDYFHQWKRIDEDVEESGATEWEIMLRSLCEKGRFLDLVENFILFDDSSSGGTIKAMAANHQFLGVNRSFQAVKDREARRGRLGVFWHTQGSGKSYSMVFLGRKVHRKLHGSFTFVILTDRVELDEQIAKTFAGTGAVEEAKTVHARSGEHLKALLREEHRFVFTVIHKFNKDDEEPYTDRDDVIVIADEAHRTQYGRLAENMRRVLPNAAFFAFTGTPLMKTKEDHLTKEIFGDYISRYDFQRAVEDGATVPLHFDGRGEKLGIATPDLNDRIAEVLEAHDLDQDQERKLQRDLARDYHVLTATERLDRVARDVAGHFASRWQTGKAMLVCLDKPTSVRMHDLVTAHWQSEVRRQEGKLGELEAEWPTIRGSLKNPDEETLVRLKAAHDERIDEAKEKLEWLRSTEISVVVSEEQGEVAKFRDLGLDIVPHREKMKSRDLAEDFKKPDHPFRLVIVCAMWLTGFDVPTLSTLYLDKPMKGHTLMQAIARANRRAPGKTHGHLVDYNGMLKSLRSALATYGGGEAAGTAGEQAEGSPVQDVDALREAFVKAVTDTEEYLGTCGFELATLVASEGFQRLALLSREGAASAVNAVCASDQTRAKFEVLSREVFRRRRALVSEPQLVASHRHQANAIEAIYKRLQENREAADISQVMADLRDVVSAAITHRGPTRLPGAESGKLFDISMIDFDKLRKEFEGRENRETTVQTMKDAIEKKLKRLVSQNPARVNFYERYLKIIEEYNKETDRATIEKTFEELLRFVGELSEEEHRAVREGLSEEHLAVFDILASAKEELPTRERNRVKEVASELLDAIQAEIAKIDHWREKKQTQALVRQMIFDHLFSEETGLPVEAYSPDEVKALTEAVYLFVFDRYADEPSAVLGLSGSAGEERMAGGLSA